MNIIEMIRLLEFCFQNFFLFNRTNPKMSEKILKIGRFQYIQNAIRDEDSKDNFVVNQNDSDNGNDDDDDNDVDDKINNQQDERLENLNFDGIKKRSDNEFVLNYSLNVRLSFFASKSFVLHHYFSLRENISNF